MSRNNPPLSSDNLIYSNPIKTDPPRMPAKMPVIQGFSSVEQVKTAPDQNGDRMGHLLEESDEAHLPEADIVEDSFLGTFEGDPIDVELEEARAGLNEPDFEVTEDPDANKKAWIMFGIVRNSRRVEGCLMAMVQVSSIEKNKAVNLKLAEGTPKKEVWLDGHRTSLKGPKDGLYLIMKTRDEELMVLGGMEYAPKIKQSVVRAAFDRIRSVEGFKNESLDAEESFEE